jgi:hypothetical protein
MSGSTKDSFTTHPAFPAKAGIHVSRRRHVYFQQQFWIPACAGRTGGAQAFINAKHLLELKM